MEFFETATPVLGFIGTFVGTLTAIVVGYIALRKAAARAFTEAVTDVILPVLEEKLNARDAKAEARSTEVDEKFGSMHRELDDIKRRISKTNETVATKIPDPPGNGS